MSAIEPQLLVKLVVAANASGAKDTQALDDLIRANYRELRRIAQAAAAGFGPGISLNPTGLVHEAYLRLVRESGVTTQGLLFFRRCFARVCREVLVDHARARHRAKRGGDPREAPPAGQAVLAGKESIDILVLDDLITVLAKESPREATVVELLFFACMTVAECAQALGVSTRTVNNDWKSAREWLRVRLDGT